MRGRLPAARTGSGSTRSQPRCKKKFPGTNVKFVLTPINNAQFTAQIAAAFASKRVPDVMLVYSGGYTTPYMLSSLDKLNDLVNADAGFSRARAPGTCPA